MADQTVVSRHRQGVPLAETSKKVHRFHTRCPLALVLAFAIVLAEGATGKGQEAGGWPVWMGPRGDGSYPVTGIFPEEGAIVASEVWRRSLGNGYSSISVAEGRAYSLSLWNERYYLLAFDSATGKDLWTFAMSSSVEGSKVPMSTPAVTGDRVVALDGAGRFHAFDVESGQLLWSRDLKKEFGASPPSYGFSTSPWIENDLALVLAGGDKGHNLLAFDIASGKLVWAAGPAKLGSYASPIVGKLAGQRQVVVPAGDLLYGLSAESGRLLWSQSGLGYPDRNPLLLPDSRVFLPLEAAGVMMALEESESGLRIFETWRSTELESSYSPAVFLDDSLYGMSNSDLICLDATTGKVRWREPLDGGSLILVDRHLLVIDGLGSGRFRMVRADPEEYHERLVRQVFESGSQILTPPSFAEGRVYLRSQKELVALEISADDTLTTLP